MPVEGLVWRNVWNNWTTATSSTAVYTQTWTTWNTNVTASTSNNVWVNWTTPTITYVPAAPVVADPAREQRARELAARYEQERRDRTAKLQKAAGRARELLRLVLTAEQWAAYEANKEFEVVGSGGNRYRIKHGAHGNVYRLEADEVVESLCAQPAMRTPDGDLPTEDAVIAQVLTLTTDEDAFRDVANIVDYRSGRVRYGTRRAA